MQSPDLKSLFLLNPEITFLNFGSFGSTPKPIYDDYQNWQLKLERDPVQFMAFKGPEYLKQSREALAKFINCNAGDVVYVTNPSYAMNIVAKNLDLKPGDEVLSTNMEYGACDRIFKYYCGLKGAKYIQQEITLPIKSKEQFIEDFFNGLSDRTKAIFIGQITSATALILPVKEICEIAKSKGLLTIVDGAHVPGHIPLDLQDLKADIYTGACHKWMMTPKGCSFLYVKNEYQKMMDPLMVSWGYMSDKPSDSQFLDYHQMQGTRDFTAFLTVPAAIKFMEEHQWEKIKKQSRRLVLEMAPKFCKLLNAIPLCPLTEEFVPQMFSIPVQSKDPEKLQFQLYQKFKIEIPVTRLAQRVFIRYSINAFNSKEDLEKLFIAMETIMKENPELLFKF